MRRLFWMIGGWVALAVGVLGVFLPLLPTTPFLLAAAFCFARGSERTYRWLLGHRLFGPPIHDWNAYGAISRRAKWAAMIAIVLVVVISYIAGVGIPVMAIQIAVLAVVSGFILSRPFPPDEGEH